MKKTLDGGPYIMADIVKIYKRHLQQLNGKEMRKSNARNSQNLKIMDIFWSHLVCYVWTDQYSSETNMERRHWLSKIQYEPMNFLGYICFFFFNPLTDTKILGDLAVSPLFGTKQLLTCIQVNLVMTSIDVSVRQRVNL